MNNKSKKIIAREGLIILIIIFANLVFAAIKSSLFYLYCRKEAMDPAELTKQMQASDAIDYGSVLVFAVVIYIFYLLIRFIILAVKMLKQK